MTGVATTTKGEEGGMIAKKDAKVELKKKRINKIKYNIFFFS